MGNHVLNQPGFNGMIRDLKHCSYKMPKWLHIWADLSWKKMEKTWERKK
jgi:hypothetical protein